MPTYRTAMSTSPAAKIIIVEGEIGAGKTELTKAIADELDSLQ